MAMRAINEVHDSAIIRQLVTMDEMDLFMSTFDQTVTVGEHPLTFSGWAIKNEVQVMQCASECDIALGLLALSPIFQHKDYADDALYEVGCLMHGSEQEYINFLMLISNR